MHDASVAIPSAMKAAVIGEQRISLDRMRKNDVAGDGVACGGDRLVGAAPIQGERSA